MFLPTFHTDRLILKPVSILDYQSYQKYFANYNIIGHLSNRVPWPYPDNGAYVYLSKFVVPNQGKDFWMWGIFLKTNPSELIGAVDFYGGRHLNNRSFWLGEIFWGQGLMTEVIVPLTDYAFNALGFSELQLSNALGNERSRAIKLKQGAKFLGITDCAHVNPLFTKSERWLLLKYDWFSIKRS